MHPPHPPKYTRSLTLSITHSLTRRDTNGTGEPPFSVFVGNSDPSTPGSYTVLDNTNCTAYPAQFSANSQGLAVPCNRQGRFVVIKSNIGPLVLCEVLVHGKSMLVVNMHGYQLLFLMLGRNIAKKLDCTNAALHSTV